MLPSYYFQEVKQLFAAFIRLTLSNFISTAHLRLFPNQSLSTLQVHRNRLKVQRQGGVVTDGVGEGIFAHVAAAGPL